MAAIKKLTYFWHDTVYDFSLELLATCTSIRNLSYEPKPNS